MVAEDWKARKDAVFAAQEQALRGAEAREHEKAHALIIEGIRRFREAGIEPVALSAAPYAGGRRVKTHSRGWYLTSDRRLGLDEDGNFLVLTAPGGVLTRLRGAHIEPSLAQLVVGRGGRDGEQASLTELLAMRLEDPVAPAKRHGGIVGSAERRPLR